MTTIPDTITNGFGEIPRADAIAAARQILCGLQTLYPGSPMHAGDEAMHVIADALNGEEPDADLANALLDAAEDSQG